MHRKAQSPALLKRNNVIREIVGFGNDDNARKLWKTFHGYHRRSLVETAMYKIKQLTGSNLRSREYSRQQTEALIKCLVVNKMSRLGMPQGVWIDAA